MANSRNPYWNSNPAPKPIPLGEKYRRFVYLVKKSRRPMELTSSQFAALLRSTTCHYCPAPADYIDAKTWAAGYTEANTVPSCVSCHKRKSNSSYADFTARRQQELAERRPGLARLAGVWYKHVIPGLNITYSCTL